MPDPVAIVGLAGSAVSGATAVYAVVLSRRALTWQQKRDAERRATHVRIELEPSTASSAVMFVVPDPDPRPEPVEYMITVVVINDGETTEYVRDLWFEEAPGTLGDVDGTRGVDLISDANRELPPRGRVSEEAWPGHYDFDAAKGFVGTARLASGEILSSEPHFLEPSLLEHIERHNAGARPS